MAALFDGFLLCPRSYFRRFLLSRHCPSPAAPLVFALSFQTKRPVPSSASPPVPMPFKPPCATSLSINLKGSQLALFGITGLSQEVSFGWCPSALSSSPRPQLLAHGAQLRFGIRNNLSADSRLGRRALPSAVLPSAKLFFLFRHAPLAKLCRAEPCLDRRYKISWTDGTRSPGQT
eukprot:1050215-Pleurochrysis_carterae.AAC.1